MDAQRGVVGAQDARFGVDVDDSARGFEGVVVAGDSPSAVPTASRTSAPANSSVV